MKKTFSFLGQTEWPALSALANAEERCECDLSETRVAYPAGVVALVLTAVRQAEAGRPMSIRLPQSSDVSNYLERIDFFAKLSELAEFDPDPADLARNRRYPADTLTEVLTPEDEDFDAVLDLTWSHFRAETPETLTQFYSAFEEVLRNIRDHSRPDAVPAFACVQVQVYRNSVEFAFGDLGVGFLATLRQNPELTGLRSESEAIESALVHWRSRLGHEDPDRGGGLRRAADVVQALGGEMKVLSGNGTGGVRGHGRPAFGTLGMRFPGSLVWMKLPRQRQPS